jgi:hypothetical protein
MCSVEVCHEDLDEQLEGAAVVVVEGSRSSPAVQIEPGLGADWLADRLVVVTKLAEELDRTTLELALRLVPVRWWEDRLGTRAGLGARAARRTG